MIETASPNHDERPDSAAIDMLVLHYTGMPSAKAALARLCDAAARVSAHYLIDEDGTVHRLVGEGRRAWHAGVASWRGNTDVNGRSVGIELVNPGHEFGYRAFPAAQMAALVELAVDVIDRHSIPPRNIVGHSDVAPVRKLDPGELFDWAGLAGQGIGLWPAVEPSSTEANPADTVSLLSRYGYDTTDTGAALAAFQRHFRPDRSDGEADSETFARLAALLAAADDVTG